jgi:hypothetical protein
MSKFPVKRTGPFQGCVVGTVHLSLEILPIGLFKFLVTVICLSCYEEYIQMIVTQVTPKVSDRAVLILYIKQIHCSVCVNNLYE